MKRVRPLGFWKEFYWRHADRLKAKSRKDYQKSKEVIKARAKAWNLANPERHKEHLAKCKSNPSRILMEKEKAKEWRKKNKEKLNVKWHQRRALKKGNGGKHTLAEWKEVKRAFGYKCACCHRPESEVKLTKDHIVPISKGGTDNIQNIQPLCSKCNSKKLNKTIIYPKI